MSFKLKKTKDRHGAEPDSGSVSELIGTVGLFTIGLLCLGLILIGLERLDSSASFLAQPVRSPHAALLQSLRP